MKLPYYPISLAAVFLLLLVTACAPQFSGQAVQPARDLLYYDDFSPAQTGAWLTEADDKGFTAVADGRLLIDITGPNLIQFVTLRDPQFDDFILEVDVKQLSGTPDSSHGVLFRMQGPESFYRLAITGTGFYILERRDADGSWHRFMRDWLESSAIYQGLEATNRLRVDAVGAQLSVYINGELVQRVVDDSYDRGTIALEAGTFGPGTAQVAFDNLVVRKP